MLRNMRKRAGLSSDKINDSFTEIGQDLSQLSSEWNSFLIPLLSTIPDGTDDTDIDAFTEGLSGKTIYVDDTATAILNSDYYNTTLSRPNTCLEQFNAVYDYVDEQVAASEQYTTVAKTASDNILSTQSDTVFYNSGIVKPTLTLPSGSDGEGLSYLFYVTSATGLRISALAGDTIALGADTSAIAGYIESTTVGSSVRLINIAANQWIAIYYTGSWSVV
jgi:hypothetical protein